MVFRYPLDPSTDYIKRVVGLPGDEVSFHNQRVYLNGQIVPLEPLPPHRASTTRNRGATNASSSKTSARPSTASSLIRNPTVFIGPTRR